MSAVATTSDCGDRGGHGSAEALVPLSVMMRSAGNRFARSSALPSVLPLSTARRSSAG
jgi:hypothetical protein